MGEVGIEDVVFLAVPWAGDGGTNWDLDCREHGEISPERAVVEGVEWYGRECPGAAVEQRK